MIAEMQDMAGLKGASFPGLMEDYKYSHYDPSFLTRISDRRQKAQEFAMVALRERQEFDEAYKDIFSKIYQLWDENFDFVLRNIQWTPEDEKAIISRGRKPYVMNVLKPYARRMLAEQLGQRWDWRAIPTDEKSAEYAECANHILRWIYQTNKFHRIASRVYRDGIIGGIGVSGTSLDPFNPKGAVKIDHYRPQEFTFDIYTATNEHLDGCEYVSRKYQITRKALGALYPEWDFSEVATDFTSTTLGTEFTLRRPKIKPRTGEIGVTERLNGYLTGMGNRMVEVTEFYRRRHEAGWVIRNGYTQTEEFYTNVNEAYQRGAILTQFYLETYAQQGGDPRAFVSKVSLPMPRTITKVNKYFFVGDYLIDVQEDREDRIPYQFYIPEFTDGHISSFFDGSKDPQRLRNVAAGVIHQQMAGMKPTRLINKAKITTKMTDQQIQEKNVRSGELWIFNDPTAKDMSNFLVDVPAPSHGPLAQVVHNVASGDIDINNGGLNSIGVTENAGESGRAIQMRRSAASMASAPSLDVLREWQTNVGEDALYLAQFMDSSITMTVIDEMDVPSHRALIDDGIQSIKGMSFSVLVKEVVASPSERDARMDRILAMMQNIPDEAADFAPIAVKYADIDSSDRKQYEANRKARAEQEQARYREEMDMKAKELEAKAVDRQIQNEIRMKEVEIAGKPKISASLKLPATPAIIGETMTASLGEEVHPLAVAGDVAFGDKMDLEKLEEEAKILAKYDQKATTAKDSAARSNKTVDKD